MSGEFPATGLFVPRESAVRTMTYGLLLCLVYFINCAREAEYIHLQLSTVY